MKYVYKCGHKSDKPNYQYVGTNKRTNKKNVCPICSETLSHLEYICDCGETLKISKYTPPGAVDPKRIHKLCKKCTPKQRIRRRERYDKQIDGEPVHRTNEKIRYCRLCGMRLSIYNLDDICFNHRDDSGMAVYGKRAHIG